MKSFVDLLERIMLEQYRKCGRRSKIVKSGLIKRAQK
jgi:hypothetical protein